MLESITIMILFYVSFFPDLASVTPFVLEHTLAFEHTQVFCNHTTMFWDHGVLSLAGLISGFLVHLSGKLHFETNIWVLGGLLAVAVLIFLGLFSKLTLILMYWKNM